MTEKASYENSNVGEEVVGKGKAYEVGEKHMLVELLVFGVEEAVMLFVLTNVSTLSESGALLKAAFSVFHGVSHLLIESFEVEPLLKLQCQKRD